MSSMVRRTNQNSRTAWVGDIQFLPEVVVEGEREFVVEKGLLVKFEDNRATFDK